MKSNYVKNLSGFTLLIFSIVLLFWGFFPSPLETKESEISQSELLKGDLVSFDSIPLDEETKPKSIVGHGDNTSSESAGLVQIESPEWIRSGDGAVIRMTFFPNPRIREDKITLDSSLLPDRNSSEGQNQLLIARLDLQGIPHMPSGEISQALKLAHPTTFLWNLRGNNPHKYSGNIWLMTGYIPKDEDEEIHRVLLNHQLIISVRKFLGLNGFQARLTGVLGVIIGLWLVLNRMNIRKILVSRYMKLGEKEEHNVRDSNPDIRSG